jgi:hypothetical protein
LLQNRFRVAGVGFALKPAAPRPGDAHILPETKRNGDLLCAGAGVDGEREDAGSADDIAGWAGRERPNLGDQSAVAEKLVALLDGRQLQDQRLRVRWSAKMKAEPGKLGVFGVALLGPIVGRLQGWPMGIVEARLSPAGIIACGSARRNQLLRWEGVWIRDRWVARAMRRERQPRKAQRMPQRRPWKSRTRSACQPRFTGSRIVKVEWRLQYSGMSRLQGFFGFPPVCGACPPVVPVKLPVLCCPAFWPAGG